MLCTINVLLSFLSQFLRGIKNEFKTTTYGFLKRQRQLQLLGVSNRLWEYLRACEQCVHFCEHEQWSNLYCEQRATSSLHFFSASRLPFFTPSFVERKFCFAPLLTPSAKQDKSYSDISYIFMSLGYFLLLPKH